MANDIFEEYKIFKGAGSVPFGDLQNVCSSHYLHITHNGYAYDTVEVRYWYPEKCSDYGLVEIFARNSIKKCEPVLMEYLANHYLRIKILYYEPVFDSRT